MWQYAATATFRRYRRNRNEMSANKAKSADLRQEET